MIITISTSSIRESASRTVDAIDVDGFEFGPAAPSGEASTSVCEA